MSSGIEPHAFGVLVAFTSSPVIPCHFLDKI